MQGFRILSKIIYRLLDNYAYLYTVQSIKRNHSMKLILVYYSGDGYTYSCTDSIPFEYASIDDFKYLVLEKIKEHKDACIAQHGKKDGEIYYRNGIVKLFDRDFNVGNIEDSIDNVYTLEEWFTKNKETV